MTTIPLPGDNPPLTTICLAAHRDPTYPRAVALRHQAAAYRDQVEGRSVQHVATFRRTVQQASAASALLQLTVNRKGSLMFDGDGLLVPNKRTAQQMLDCYRQAGLCADAATYFHVVIADPRGRDDLMDAGEVGRWPLPCRRVNPSHLAFGGQHPAGATHLIQAATVRNGSQWCPNFRARDFRAVVEGEAIVAADG